jgi:hypothetical protein
MHVSEYGKTAADKPERAREIRTGAPNAVAKGGKLAVESTAHGTNGEFYDLMHCSQERWRTHHADGSRPAAFCRGEFIELLVNSS